MCAPTRHLLIEERVRARASPATACVRPTVLARLRSRPIAPTLSRSGSHQVRRSVAHLIAVVGGGPKARWTRQCWRPLCRCNGPSLAPVKLLCIDADAQANPARGSWKSTPGAPTRCLAPKRAEIARTPGCSGADRGTARINKFSTTGAASSSAGATRFCRHQDQFDRRMA